MSSYVHGSSISYRDYLQAKEFVDDIRWDISQANLNFVATNQTLQKFGVELSAGVDRTNAALEQTNRALEHGFDRVQEGLEQGFGAVTEQLQEVDKTLGRGFVTLHSDLMSVDSSVQDLSAKFEWGFSELLVSLGSANESLAALVKLARTPEQTWAFEQYEIARDAFRRGLFREALEYVERAINGHQGHTGYSIEHRFHSLVGVIRLGSYKNHAPEIVSEEKAYDAFQGAARYAMTDYRDDAARALCGAAQAAYCLGRFDAAEAHANEALRLNPHLGEAAFQLAKTLMHLDKVEKALPALAHAIKLDPLYSLRSFDDPDFTKHENAVRRVIEHLRADLSTQCTKDIAKWLELFRTRADSLASIANGRLACDYITLEQRACDWVKGEEAKLQELAGSAAALIATNRYLDTVSAAGRCRELFDAVRAFSGKAADYLRALHSELGKVPDRVVAAYLKSKGFGRQTNVVPEGRTFLTVLLIHLALVGLGLLYLYPQFKDEVARGVAPAGSDITLLFMIPFWPGILLFGFLYWLLRRRLNEMWADRIAQSEISRDARLKEDAPTACKKATDEVLSYRQLISEQIQLITSSDEGANKLVSAA